MTRRLRHCYLVWAFLVIVIFSGSHEQAQETTNLPDSPMESSWQAEADIQWLQCGGKLRSLDVAARAWRR
ncbi:MAG TPA: hypothetical protein VNF70_04395, partial [Pyrinomonadaceae bacterium]|nr:hypothetical protein [Pyrinomonadaceae bacterium]